jgi:twitching motility protein PilT
MAVRSLIRDDKVHQLQGMIEIGQKYGMQTMNSELLKVYQRRLITKKDALSRSPDPDQMAKILGVE